MIGITNADATNEYDNMYNYLGDGSNGDVVIASGETYTIQVSEDTESAFLNCNSLLIEDGGTLTVSNRCPGLFIKVRGDCTINGTVNMNSLAPLQSNNEAELSMNPCITICGNLIGGSSGAGGKSGRDNYGNWSDYKTGGAGGTGHVFGGAYGGGGAGNSGAGGSSANRPPVGVNWPYPGGSGSGSGKYGSGGGGGFDNASSRGGSAPGGSGGAYSAGYTDGVGSASSVNGNAGSAYGGGAIYLFVGGNLTIGTTGVLTAKGGSGAAGVSGTHTASYTSDSTGSRSTIYSGSGGGGGGGVICIVYRDTIVHGGTLSVGGGSAGSAGVSACKGSSGSAGNTLIAKFEDLLSSNS